jgi:hypothetical protein
MALTITRILERIESAGVFTVLTMEPPQAPITTRTLGPMPAELRLTAHMAPGAPPRPIIPTPEPMPRPGRVPTPIARGDNPMFPRAIGPPMPQHYSNANGTVGSIQGSQGGAAGGASTKYGNTAVGKTSSGDMYADHNGNVYKNTGSGWQKYDNGSWNPVQRPDNDKNATNANRTGNTGSNQTAAQSRGQSSQLSSTSGTSRENGQSFARGSGGSSSRAGSSGASDVDRDFQNRQRGGSQSQRFSSFQRSGGGGDRSGGARRGDVRRR